MIGIGLSISIGSTGRVTPLAPKLSVGVTATSSVVREIARANSVAVTASASVGRAISPAVSIPNALGGWAFAATSLAGSQLAPDGTSTGAKFTATAGGTVHDAQTVITHPHGGTVRLTLWLKAGATIHWLLVQLSNGTPSGSVVYLDLLNGVAGTGTTVASGGASVGLATAVLLGTAVSLGVGSDAAWQKWQVDGVQTAGTTLFLAQATADNTLLGSAAGTESTLIGSGATFGPTLVTT